MAPDYLESLDLYQDGTLFNQYGTSNLTFEGSQGGQKSPEAAPAPTTKKKAKVWPIILLLLVVAAAIFSYFYFR